MAEDQLKNYQKKVKSKDPKENFNIEVSCTIFKFVLKYHRKVRDCKIISTRFYFALRACSCSVYIYSAILNIDFRSI